MTVEASATPPSLNSLLVSVVDLGGEAANKTDNMEERTSEEITFPEEREKLDGVPMTKFATEDKELFDGLLPKHCQGQDDKAQQS